MERQGLLKKIENKKLELAKIVENFGFTNQKCVELNMEVNQLVIQHQKLTLKTEAENLLVEINRKKADLMRDARLSNCLTAPGVVRTSEQLDKLVLRYQKIMLILKANAMTEKDVI